MINRWNELWKKLGTTKNMESLYYQIIKAYSEKNRAYHNISHVEQCLNEFDQVKDRLKNPEEVELAIWFHDVIYNPKSISNEEESAEFAILELKKTEPINIRIDTVKGLILATKHDRSINTPDAEYLVDIDISIFGYPPKIYKQYTKNIRTEYEWVPYSLYKKNEKNF